MKNRLLPLFSILLFLDAVKSHQIDKQKIKKVFENLFELDGRAEAKGGRLPVKARSYMKNLYDEAAESGMDGVVRTVAPLIETRDGEQVMVFPLSHLQIGHRLVRAELHILGSRADKMSKVLRMEAITAAGNRMPLKLLPSSTGVVLWNAVHPILYNFANSTNLVVKLSRSDGRRLRPLRTFVSRHSPFLTVYTRANAASAGVDSPGLRKKRNAHEGNYFTYESEDSNVLSKGREEYKERGPALLNTRVKETKFTRRRYEKIKHQKPWWGFGENAEEEQEDPNRVLVIGNEKEQKERIGERTLEMTTAINKNEMDVVLLQPEMGENSICGKQILRVDFGEIGWSDWIISPLSFDAGICGGACEFPLPRESRASNHALVQSALSDGSSGLPSVCCAPDRMDSLSVLYNDANKHIVLRNFPRMVVNSCGCI